MLQSVVLRLGVRARDAPATSKTEIPRRRWSPCKVCSTPTRRFMRRSLPYGSCSSPVASRGWVWVTVVITFLTAVLNSGCSYSYTFLYRSDVPQILSNKYNYAGTLILCLFVFFIQDVTYLRRSLLFRVVWRYLFYSLMLLLNKFQEEMFGEKCGFSIFDAVPNSILSIFFITYIYRFSVAFVFLQYYNWQLQISIYFDYFTVSFFKYLTLSWICTFFCDFFC